MARRAVNVRSTRRRFLITCEGAKTEPNYFRRFRVNAKVERVEVEVLGLGDHTLSLVKRTCELMREGKFDEIWCVLDRDSFPPERFNAALDLAEREGIRVAYSNEAFELWYVLHFQYHDVAISRDEYGHMLTKNLGIRYQKNAPDMYERLLEYQPDAIRNAEKLRNSYGADHNPERDNPCTSVYELVQQLNHYSR